MHFEALDVNFASALATVTQRVIPYVPMALEHHNSFSSFVRSDRLALYFTHFMRIQTCKKDHF
jgi:hypothetical protein